MTAFGWGVAATLVCAFFQHRKAVSWLIKAPLLGAVGGGWVYWVCSLIKNYYGSKVTDFDRGIREDFDERVAEVADLKGRIVYFDQFVSQDVELGRRVKVLWEADRKKGLLDEEDEARLFALDAPVDHLTPPEGIKDVIEVTRLLGYRSADLEWALWYRMDLVLGDRELRERFELKMRERDKLMEEV